MHEVCSPSWQKMHAVGVGERHDNEITGLDRANVGFDDADRLVSHDTTAIGVFHRLVRPEIAAADAGAGDSDDRVGWLDKAGVGGSGANLKSWPCSGALNGVAGRIDDVAEQIVAGEPKALMAFTETVCDLLSTEHKQWLEGTAQAAASLEKLDAQLKQLQTPETPGSPRTPAAPGTPEESDQPSNPQDSNRQ